MQKSSPKIVNSPTKKTEVLRPWLTNYPHCDFGEVAGLSPSQFENLLYDRSSRMVHNPRYGWCYQPPEWMNKHFPVPKNFVQFVCYNSFSVIKFTVKR